MPAIRMIYNNEKGMVLPLGLMFLAIIAILGTTAVIITTTDLKIGSNYRASEQAFYAAEAGISEALYRLSLFDDGGTNAPPSGSMININGLTGSNAAISIDPNGLLENNSDDDGNGAVDDISDLNFNGTYDNRNWQTKILLKTSDEIDDIDTETTVHTPTIQPSGNWIEYSSSIEFLKDTEDMDDDTNTSEIVFYNANLANPLNVDTAATTASGQPVVVISSTGRSQGSTCVIRVEAVHQPVDIDAKSAVMVNLSPTISGSAIISGLNHKISTTSADEKDGPNWHHTIIFNNGVDNHGGAEDFFYCTPTKTKCASPDVDTQLQNIAVNPYPNNEEEKEEEEYIPYGQKLKATGHKPGVWTPLPLGTVSPSADVFGGDGLTTPWKVEEAPAWLTLADLLGVTPEVLTSILDSANVTEADMGDFGELEVAPQGVMYINNAGNKLNITSSTPDSDKGWGLMYVTGDVNFQNLEFKGLIYVEGDAHITGTFWLMGCMSIKGVTSGNFSSGNGTFLYSCDALNKYVNKGMKFVTLSWYDDLS